MRHFDALTVRVLDTFGNVKLFVSDFHAYHFFLDNRFTGSDTALMTPVLPGMTWYKLSEVAEILNIRYVTAWRLVRAGRLKAVNVSPRGGRPTWRVHPEEIERFRKERT